MCVFHCFNVFFQSTFVRLNEKRKEKGLTSAFLHTYALDNRPNTIIITEQHYMGLCH
jgi:hypothetical protein